MEIGAIINRLRKSKKMTLSELSGKSGVAVATLSRMENGRMTGTIGSHMNICKALEISLPDLYRELSDSNKTVEVRETKKKPEMISHNRKYSSEILASNTLNKKMMPVLIKIEKGGLTTKDEAKIGAEKFVYILEGKIEASIGNERYNLTPGDTLYFESSLSHSFKNTGTGEAKILSVTCPPSA
mgnify:CR=1 FL=1